MGNRKGCVGSVLIALFIVSLALNGYFIISDKSAYESDVQALAEERARFEKHRASFFALEDTLRRGLIGLYICLNEVTNHFAPMPTASQLDSTAVSYGGIYNNIFTPVACQYLGDAMKDFTPWKCFLDAVETRDNLHEGKACFFSHELIIRKSEGDSVGTIDWRQLDWIKEYYKLYESGRLYVTTPEFNHFFDVTLPRYGREGLHPNEKVPPYFMTMTARNACKIIE